MVIVTMGVVCNHIYVFLAFSFVKQLGLIESALLL